MLISLTLRTLLDECTVGVFHPFNIGLRVYRLIATVKRGDFARRGDIGTFQREFSVGYITYVIHSVRYIADTKFCLQGANVTPAGKVTPFYGTFNSNSL